MIVLNHNLGSAFALDTGVGIDLHDFNDSFVPTLINRSQQDNGSYRCQVDDGEFKYCNTVLQSSRASIVITILMKCNDKSSGQIYAYQNVAVKGEREFYLVTIFNIDYLNGRRLYSCCSLCNSDFDFTSGLIAMDFSCVEAPDESDCFESFFACRHINTTLTTLMISLRLSVSVSKASLYSVLSSTLVEDDWTTKITERDWLPLSNKIIRKYSEEVKLYVSFGFQLGLFISDSEKVGEVAYKKYSCVQCLSSRGCSHIRAIKEDKAENIHPLFEKIVEDDAKVKDEKYPCLSKVRYPCDFKADIVLVERIKQRNKYGLEWFLKNGFIISMDVKECCSQQMEWLRYESGILISNLGISISPCPFYRCSICGATASLDGRSYGLLNYGNKFMICVEVFIEFLELKVDSGIAVTAWWKSKV